jgi:hypothetical protein
MTFFCHIKIKNMNIFVLDKDPHIAAEMHCDKHALKMIIEHAQMMASAYYSTIGISRKKEIPEPRGIDIWFSHAAQYLGLLP